MCFASFAVRESRLRLVVRNCARYPISLSLGRKMPQSELTEHLNLHQKNAPLEAGSNFFSPFPSFDFAPFPFWKFNFLIDPDSSLLPIMLPLQYRYFPLINNAGLIVEKAEKRRHKEERDRQLRLEREQAEAERRAKEEAEAEADRNKSICFVCGTYHINVQH